MGFILMYDITNEESFNAVQDWYVTSQKPACVLVCVCVCVCVCLLEMTDSNKVFLKCALRATQIKTYSWDNAQVIMVGNKCDMDEERVVPPEKGKHLADQLGETCCTGVPKHSSAHISGVDTTLMHKGGSC